VTLLNCLDQQGSAKGPFEYAMEASVRKKSATKTTEPR
jgi:hypothetical protein